jgi:hypothetical protein
VESLPRTDSDKRAEEKLVFSQHARVVEWVEAREVVG